MGGERGVEGAGKLRNSEVKLRWWWVVVVGGGGMRGFSRQVDFVDLVNWQTGIKLFLSL